VIVFDASVLVKLFAKERFSEIAEAVIDHYSLVFAPELVRVEVAGAITRKVRNKELSREDAVPALESWRKFLKTGSIQLTPDEELLPAAEILSLNLRHPLPDCLYLALAKRNKVSLVTADQPFVAAVKEKFPEIRHLGEFEGGVQ